MRLRDDERGQAIQIGAVLLFGLLIISFATYQAIIVPEQNEGIEVNHNLQAQSEFESLRNVILGATSRQSSRSVRIQLGTEYPGRLLGVNPGPATGTLRTAGTTDDRVAVRITNATARGEVGDFWDGRTHRYRTGWLVYDPLYSEYQEAPTTTYENTVVYNEFRSGNRTVTGQRLIDGTTISLVTLNGSLSTSRAGTTTVDPRYVSASTNTVPITTNTSGLYFEYYEADYSSEFDMPDYDQSNLVRTGFTSNFDVFEDDSRNSFAFRFNGTIDVPATDTYTFYTRSDDGSILEIDGTEVVDNSGQHAPNTESGTITLSEGEHDIGVAFFEDDGQNTLTVEWESPNISRQEIPDRVLSNERGGSATPIELSVPTRLDNETWRQLLDEEFTANGGHVQDMDVVPGDPPYEYYEADYSSEFDMPEFDRANLVTTGGTDNFDIKELKQRDDGYAFRFNKRITVPEDGTYTFYTTSDDGSRLYIDGTRVVNNDGQHANQTRSGSISLDEGTHDITVTFFEDDGLAGLTVEWEGPSVSREEIPDDVLSSRRTADRLALTLEPGETYQLRMARVGLGTRVADQQEAYLAPVSGNGTSVAETDTRELVVEVRDRLNNPVSGVLVNATADRGAVQPRVETSDGDGRILLTYDPPDVDGSPVTDTIDVSTVVDPASTPIDADTPENVTFEVTVENTDRSGITMALSGGGTPPRAYGVDLRDPSNTTAPADNPNADLTDCGSDNCTWDVSASQDATLTLRGETEPDVEGLTMEFAGNDSTVGTLDPQESQTSTGGNATTQLRALANGTVEVVGSTRGGAASINVSVTNVTNLGFVFEVDATARDQSASPTDAPALVDFNLTSTLDTSAEITGITINETSNGTDVQSDGSRSEVEIGSNGKFDGTVQVGTRYPLDQTESVASDETIRVQLVEFRQNDDTPANMIGETATFTIHYTADGQQQAETFDIRPITERN